jgi:uracil-DNA glycosylase
VTVNTQPQRSTILGDSELNEQILNCRKCRLWQGARNAVVGEGPATAKIMLVGQNPGEEEDKEGKPFIGRSGKFLNKVLAKNGIRREELFVTNVVKHLTPENRKPLTDEIAACSPYLLEQMEKLRPKIVVLLGAVAWQAPRLPGIEYIETVHPSAAMRFTKMRKRFEEDFASLAKKL